MPDIFDGDEELFWKESESLQAIYNAAIGAMCSPWAVLAHCVAKALSIVPPHVTLPPIIGSKGSLNLCLGIVAKSGGGKDAAAGVADQLFAGRDHTVPVRNLGSGEGLIEAYRKPKDPETGEPGGQYPAIQFLADEIDTVGALRARTGSTLMPYLRSSFNAAVLGATTKASGGFHLGKHSYRLTLVMSIQPARAGWLLDDQAGGTPQRFMFFPGRDPRITADAATDFGPPALHLPPIDAWTYPQELTVPSTVWMVVRDNREAQNRDDDPLDTLDGHALFTREKFAYGLTVLDGRTKMTARDWDMASLASRVSDSMRDWMALETQMAKRVEAEDHGRLQGVAAMGRQDELSAQTAARIERYANRMVRYLGEDSTRPMARNDLLKRFKAEERLYFDQTLKALTNVGSIEADIDGKFWLTGCVPDGLRRAGVA
jgi:hypothetical protein